jgi:hypothetical protein
MSEKEGVAARGKRILDRIDAEERETAKKFDPALLVEESEKIQTIHDAVLGEVKFTPLTTKDLFELSKVQGEYEQTTEIFFRLFRKAYPKLKSPDDIGKLPGDKLTRLSELLNSKENFFQIPRKFQRGSNATTSPST